MGRDLGRGRGWRPCKLWQFNLVFRCVLFWLGRDTKYGDEGFHTDLKNYPNGLKNGWIPPNGGGIPTLCNHTRFCKYCNDGAWQNDKAWPLNDFLTLPWAVCNWWLAVSSCERSLWFCWTSWVFSSLSNCSFILRVSFSYSARPRCGSLWKVDRRSEETEEMKSRQEWSELKVKLPPLIHVIVPFLKILYFDFKRSTSLSYSKQAYERKNKNKLQCQWCVRVPLQIQITRKITGLLSYFLNLIILNIWSSIFSH